MGRGPKRRWEMVIGAGFLGVIDEVALGVEVGVFADDFDGVLVGADGAVGAQAEEDGPHDVVGFDIEIAGRRAARCG